MPRIKSAKKRVLVSEKRRKVNVARKSAIKTAVRKVLDAIDAKKLEDAQSLLKIAESSIARAKGKGVMHKNMVARKISRLAKKVSLLAQAAV
ncbi:30S ribosomal protein S20 [bacterium]|nr:MAG: 30S ribosomal protein S20 [bacterium]QQR61783.1 MAG: 30S ribosomal protein S20 [bacterium]QQR62639.1 MAG: 30S ribosomal protein S20 [bacterium]